uniref:T-cell surface glycoprotein CD3 zeta chain n=1 Tax=Acanthochromis polyacanthus TaxID=80966 RepID=A0A3Q1F592_9TELE
MKLQQEKNDPSHPVVHWKLLLVFSSALEFYDPELCFILDGFLGLYGLVITGMFIKERVGPGSGSFPLMRDAERGRVSSMWFCNRTGSSYSQTSEGSSSCFYICSPENLCGGLSSATRDTYDSLQMQPLR